MTTLNDTQVSLIKDIANRDPAFRAVLQQRLQVELDATVARASELKEAIGGTVVEPTVAPAPVAPVRLNKAAALRRVLAEHPNSTVSEIAAHLA
ncbi:MAG TPA: hypothetical protein VM577_05650, partial [Anaerovoracaceae bacterium]|nr:hypothetical protein [Anaerovoracaceae bacterium]